MSGPYTKERIPVGGGGVAWRIADGQDNPVATCYCEANAIRVQHALNAVSAVPIWRPCECEMPSVGERVLAVLRTGEITTLAWWPDSGFWAPGVIGPGPIYRPHKVTHWMPLPESPHGGDCARNRPCSAFGNLVEAARMVLSGMDGAMGYLSDALDAIDGRQSEGPP